MAISFKYLLSTPRAAFRYTLCFQQLGICRALFASSSTVSPKISQAFRPGSVGQASCTLLVCNCQSSAHAMNICVRLVHADQLHTIESLISMSSQPGLMSARKLN